MTQSISPVPAAQPSTRNGAAKYITPGGVNTVSINRLRQVALSITNRSPSRSAATVKGVAVVDAAMVGAAVVGAGVVGAAVVGAAVVGADVVGAAVVGAGVGDGGGVMTPASGRG